MNKCDNDNEENNSAQSNNVATPEPQGIELQPMRESEELESSDSYVLGYN